MKIYFESELEQLENELNVLLSNSKDRNFTTYLYQLKGELSYAPQNAADIRRRAIANYEIYVNTMRTRGVNVPPYYFKAIYGDAQVEIVSSQSEPVKAESENAKDAEKESVKKETSESAPVKEAAAKSESEAAASEKAEAVEKEGAANEPVKQEEAKAEDSMEESANTESLKTEEVKSSYKPQNDYIRSYYEGHPSDSVQPTPYVQAPASPEPSSVDPESIQDSISFLSGLDSVVDSQNTEPAPPPAPAPVYSVPSFNPQNVSKKTEYAVGAVVMSVIGAVFLLTGLVYFAVNFLDTFTQGMLMYVACAVVLAVSELIVRRYVFKLSAVFTAIGISGLFLATVVNYRALGNISLPVAGVILAFCAILVCLFGFYRKSRLYSAIGFFAGFASSVAIGSDVSPVQYMVITLGTLLISCLWMIFPVEKQHKIVDTLMILAELAYLFIGLGFRIDTDSSMVVSMVKLIFGLVSWFVCQFVFYHSESDGEERLDITGFSVVNSIFIVIAGIIYSVMIAASGSSMLAESERIFIGIAAYFGMIIPSGFFAYFLNRKNISSWKVFYILFVVCGMIVVFFTENPFAVSIAFAVSIITSKVLLRKYHYADVEGLKVMDILIQIFVAVMLTFAEQLFMPDADKSLIYLFIPAAILCASMLVSMFLSSGYVVVSQILTIVSVTSAVSTVFCVRRLELVCAMGLILLFTFLINTLQRLKTNEYQVVNYITLVAEIFLLHILAARYYTGDGFFGSYIFSPEAILIYSIGAVFGLTYLIITLRKEYGMFYAEQYILVPIYLTWAMLLAPVTKNFLLSILLMAIAVVSVIIGFALKRKGIRIYGLVLSIVVCAKIAFIDFVTLDDALSKTIMYILVGAFALLIGTIYMVLESRESKALTKKNNEQGAS
ncbi:MAG: hypothetical protein J6X94_02560 [Lachnospiraceae bacterium]|nr:hypothetical protein [Lachnospiraceae bacterium]